MIQPSGKPLVELEHMSKSSRNQLSQPRLEKSLSWHTERILSKINGCYFKSLFWSDLLQSKNQWIQVQFNDAFFFNHGKEAKYQNNEKR